SRRPDPRRAAPGGSGTDPDGRPSVLRERALHDGAQDGQRQGALLEDGVVEAPDVEAVPLALARLRSQPQDLELAELVGQRLTGVADVSVHLVGDVVLAERGVLDHEVDRLLPGPAKG